MFLTNPFLVGDGSGARASEGPQTEQPGNLRGTLHFIKKDLGSSSSPALSSVTHVESCLNKGRVVWGQRLLR